MTPWKALSTLRDFELPHNINILNYSQNVWNLTNLHWYQTHLTEKKVHLDICTHIFSLPLFKCFIFEINSQNFKNAACLLTVINMLIVTWTLKLLLIESGYKILLQLHEKEILVCSHFRTHLHRKYWDAQLKKMHRWKTSFKECNFFDPIENFTLIS